jgi:hypothetical protein
MREAWLFAWKAAASLCAQKWDAKKRIKGEDFEGGVSGMVFLSFIGHQGVVAHFRLFLELRYTGYKEAT